MDVATSALHRAALGGLLAELAAAFGALFCRLDNLCLLAKKFGNHIARDLVNADNRLLLDRFEIGRREIGECSRLSEFLDDKVGDLIERNGLTGRFHGSFPQKGSSRLPSLPS